VDRTERNNDVAGPGPCPGCGYPENPAENRFCGRCGVSLERPLVPRGGELAPRVEESRATLRERFLPDRLGPVGKTVAVSLATVAAEVGLAWLHHRLEKTDRPSLPRDVGRVWREGLGGDPEYLHGYFLEEATLMLREGGEVRRSYSSEITVRSGRIEK
jgi:hypothetical protein